MTTNVVAEAIHFLPYGSEGQKPETGLSASPPEDWLFQLLEAARIPELMAPPPAS